MKNASKCNLVYYRVYKKCILHIFALVRMMYLSSINLVRIIINILNLRTIPQLYILYKKIIKIIKIIKSQLLNNEIL